MFGPENGQKEAPDNRALKEQFLDSLASIGANVLSLREAAYRAGSKTGAVPVLRAAPTLNLSHVKALVTN